MLNVIQDLATVVGTKLNENKTVGMWPGNFTIYSENIRSIKSKTEYFKA